MSTTHQHFWQQLSQPIMGLSPMDGLTDHVFRHIQKKYGNPAVMYTEFTSVEGVCHGATQLLSDFLYDETQRPIIGQIYGTTPDFFRQTAIVLCELGFDGIDINMGCPAKNVAHSGAGAALIQTPKLAQAIIKATQQGIRDWQNGMQPSDCPDISQAIVQAVRERSAQLPSKIARDRTIPVSVKTRIGFKEPSIDQWIPVLLEMQPAAITLHGRTLQQQYGGKASWEYIAQAADLSAKTDTLLLGNGDIASLEHAYAAVEKYGVSGVLVGRASLGNPYFFRAKTPADPSMYEIAVEHAALFEQTYQHSPRYSFLPMRKHLAWYVTAIPGASEIRSQLVLSQSAAEVAAIFRAAQLLPTE